MIGATHMDISRIATSHAPAWIETTTLLPSGAVASVKIEEAASGSFSVSDDASGRDDILTLGYLKLTSGDTRRANSIADKFGLMFDGSSFFLREVSAEQLSAAVVFVAEAAREWAQATAEHAQRRSEILVSRQVEEQLRRLLPDIKIDRDRELIGASTKSYRFDLVATLAGNRKAVFEVVSPNANSLSAAHLKLFDLMGAHPNWPREVVTERLSSWESADIALLSAVATHVRGVDQDWKDLTELIH